MVGFADVELFNFELFFLSIHIFFINSHFFLSIVFLNDIVGMAESPYPVVHVYTVHVL